MSAKRTMGKACRHIAWVCVVIGGGCGDDVIWEVIAGTGAAGHKDGPAALSHFNAPTGVAASRAERAVFVADTGSSRIRVIGLVEAHSGGCSSEILPGKVTTAAGSGEVGWTDGPATTARFNRPEGVAVVAQDAGPNGAQPGYRLVIADTMNHRIRYLTADGTVGTLTGGDRGFADGPLTDARFDEPAGIAVGSQGRIYVADRQNHRIRVIDHGMVSTLAGTGQAGFLDGPASSARFFEPNGVAVDSVGRVHVADTRNHRVRVVAAGEVSTLAGNGVAGYVDASSGSAQLDVPLGVAGYPDEIYVADSGNGRIRTVSGGEVRSEEEGGPDAMSAVAAFPVRIDDELVVFVSDAKSNQIWVLESYHACW